MATNIFNYNGSLLTTVQDGTIATEIATIKFPGRAYQNYGEAVNENMLWIMQCFANASSPVNPVVGQLWYDTVHSLLMFYSGSTWITAGGVFLSSTQPISGNNIGAFWYDTVNKQLHIWNGTTWDLIGPLGSATNTDPQNLVIPSFSAFESIRISDSSSVYHQIWRLTVGGSVVAIISKDAAFTPSPSITGFTAILPGINVNSSITAAGYYGDNNLFRGTQNNLPSIDNSWNLGSTSFRFANVYATLFDGVATSAQYADLAERYKSDVPLSPGTVVCLGGKEEITSCRNYGDDGVFGVVSTNPGFLMNKDAGTNDTYPAVALTGRVPCKVMGPVYKGQRLMTSGTEGIACAWNSSLGTLTILGRSLVELTTNDVKLIEVVLGKN